MAIVMAKKWQSIRLPICRGSNFHPYSFFTQYTACFEKEMFISPFIKSHCLLTFYIKYWKRVNLPYSIKKNLPIILYNSYLTLILSHYLGHLFYRSSRISKTIPLFFIFLINYLLLFCIKLWAVIPESNNVSVPLY